MRFRAGFLDEASLRLGIDHRVASVRHCAALRSASTAEQSVSRHEASILSLQSAMSALNRWSTL